MTCPQCHRAKLVRSSRKTLGDYAQAIAGLYPFRCPNCQIKTKVWSIQQAVIASMPVMGLFLCAILGTLWYRWTVPFEQRQQVFGPPPPVTIQLDGFSLETSDPPSPGEQQELLLSMGNPITNNDVVALTKAGIGQEVIVRLIKERPSQFAVQVEDLVSMRKAGVADPVLSAIIDTMTPSRVPVAEWESRSASLRTAETTGRVAIIRQ